MWRIGPWILLLGVSWLAPGRGAEPAVSPQAVRSGLRHFFTVTARPDGSYRPGVEPTYQGMSDSAYSDLAPTTYAVTLHRTFGWQLKDEEKTRQWFWSRQQPDGAFVNVQGTADPKSPLARLYNTTQGIVALHALGAKPKHDPLPVLVKILEADYKTFPGYSTSFFPLAWLASGQPFPPEQDRKMRALMVQADDGYLHNHVAATFHLVHYYRLIGAPTPKADLILARVLKEQKPDGSWMLNPLARDRHACFDAVFILTQLGGDRPDCRKAIQKAAEWVLSCRNPDGGFGHYPGSPSDADANYFHVGVLVMAGFLPPAEPLPRNPQLISWGHLMPRGQKP